MVNKRRKPYRADFKEEAVQRIQAGERVTLLSRELLVPEGTLYRWCLEAEQVSGGKPGERGKPESPAESAALQAQIRELQACASPTERDATPGPFRERYRSARNLYRSKCSVVG